MATALALYNKTKQNIARYDVGRDSRTTNGATGTTIPRHAVAGFQIILKLHSMELKPNMYNI